MVFGGGRSTLERGGAARGAATNPGWCRPRRQRRSGPARAR